MFLKEVYRHSKWMFAGMLFFIVMQLAINFKGGMVFAPFFHYGMFSESAAPERSYNIPIIKAGTDTIKGMHYSPQQWDKIVYNQGLIWGTTCDADFYEKQVARLFKKAGMKPPDPALFINKRPIPELLDSYKKQVARLVGTVADSIDLQVHEYHYLKGVFIYKENAVQFPYESHLCR